MARPKRASSVSTTKVTFRLTAEEAQRLDELVKEFGHKDRSALLRAWLAQTGPARRRSTPHEQTNMNKILVDAKHNANETATARSNRQDEPPTQPAPSNDLTLNDLFVLVVAAIHHEADSRTGWSRIPSAVRLLL